MAREKSPKAQQMRARIAAAAARMMAEDGIDDFALAKRKAARMLGATDTHSLPGNDEVETELRRYQSLYQGDEQRSRLLELRRAALAIMRELRVFRPYLAGPVLSGTAGRYAEIDLQLFTDDAKGVELFFVNRDLLYEAREHRYYCGDEPRAAPVLKSNWQGVTVNIAVFSAKDERSVLKSSLNGRAVERANEQAVACLLEDKAA